MEENFTEKEVYYAYREAAKSGKFGWNKPGALDTAVVFPPLRVQNILQSLKIRAQVV